MQIELKNESINSANCGDIIAICTKFNNIESVVDALIITYDGSDAYYAVSILDGDMAYSTTGSLSSLIGNIKSALDSEAYLRVIPNNKIRIVLEV